LGLGLPYGFHDSLVYYDVGYQPHDPPVLVMLIQPPETSSGAVTTECGSETGETRVRNMTAEFCLQASFHARRVVLHAINLRHGTDGFTSPLKEGVLRILSPLKSIVLGRV
jgi:hypothetical protein